MLPFHVSFVAEDGFGFLQGVGFDVFLEHLDAGVAGHCADVEYVHSGEVHQCGSGSSGSVGLYEFVFGYIGLLGYAAFAGLDFYEFVDFCYFSDSFDVVVYFLVCEVRKVVVVFFQYGYEFGFCRDHYCGSGLLLADVDDDAAVVVDFDVFS